MDKHSTQVFDKAPLITENRVRHARREQAEFIREGLVEARAWFGQVLRRCIALSG